MDSIQVYTQQNIQFSQDFRLEIDENLFGLGIEEIYGKSYNVRFIFEFTKGGVTYPDSLLGTKISEFIFESDISTNSEIKIRNNDMIFNTIKNHISLKQNYNLNCVIYEDLPIHNYKVLQSIPLPTNILTFYFVVSKQKLNVNRKNLKTIQKLFDGYSHLGFFMADLPRMKLVIQEHYGDRELDLVDEFSNTEIIDRLFEAGCLIITWGINPFTYPIFISEPNNSITKLLGDEVGVGKYTVDSSIINFSLIPGHKLREWPNLLNETYPIVRLEGTGNMVYLKAFNLKDEELKTVIPSFLIYRSDDYIVESSPLVNIDLLYS